MPAKNPECAAANTLKEHREALAQIEKVLQADVRPSAGMCLAGFLPKVR
ncbi:MAG TPA: hypothetical protein VIK18_26905 [Pirellulales bacterium]